MANMFNGCYSLKTLDLRNFDTSKVTDISYMFFNCTSLTTLYLSSFDTSNVTNMSCVFRECKSLHLNCSLLDVSNVEKHKNFNKHATNVLSPTWTIV